MKSSRKQNYTLLLLGIVLTALTHTRFSIGILVLVSSVPFLLYLKNSHGVKSRLLLFGAVNIAWFVAIVKIVTAPIPLAMAPIFSIPLSCFYFLGLMIWDRFKDDKYSFLIFPSVMIIMEWLQVTTTSFATWGAAAYALSEYITALQFLSVGGLFGVSFLIHLTNILIVKIFEEGFTKKRVVQTLSPMVFLVIFGSIRLFIGEDVNRETVLAAAVGTESTVGSADLPSREVRFAVQKELIKDTKQAARGGAQIVVWNEAATAVLKDEEEKFIHTVQQCAREEQITLIAAYVVPLSLNPFLYENKYLFVNPNGSIDHRYFKHEPVFGEPCIKGTEEFTAVKTSFSKIGGAICYDYDYPYIGREHGKLGVDIVCLPSSDWKGITPIHTQMASYRAIENGHNLIRSTRFGLSAGIDYYGRVLGQLSHFNTKERILYINIPTKGTKTFYAMFGDWPIWLAFLLLSIIVTKRVKKRSV